jgi:glycosyltransferase involved in cell wall biosynthesis
MKNKKLLIITTVPETLHSILKYQPRYLNDFFDVNLITSNGNDIDYIKNDEAIDPVIVPMVRGINPFYDVYSIFRMVKEILKVKPDIVHTYTPKAGLVGMIASYLCRVPVRIHTFTGLIFPTSKGFKKHVLIFIDRLISYCATTVVPEGLGVKHDLQTYRITKKTLEVIGNGNIAGVDLDYFRSDLDDIKSKAHSLSKTYGIHNDKFVFCFVGRLNKDKGIRELVAAYENMPDFTHLFLIGDIDGTAPPDAEVLERCRDNPRIHLTGFHSDIRPYLSMSDVLILPSYREGFPNALLQAGAMKLPAIASNINGCNEIIQEGINGWLVKPRSIEALQAAMLLALKDDELQVKGLEAQKLIKLKFERQNYWQELVLFYQKAR